MSKKYKKIKGKYIVSHIIDAGSLDKSAPRSREMLLLSSGKFDLKERDLIIGKKVRIILEED